MRTKTIYLVAGGTGGHVFPALAVAEKLNTLKFETYLFTDLRGAKLLEKIEKQPIKFQIIAAASPFQKSFLESIFALVKLSWGTITSFYYFLLQRPSLIIGFGGYPSFPSIMAGRVLGIPILLHEQNALIGRANHLLSKFSDMLALSWENTKNLPEKITYQLTGVPVRQAFFDAAKIPFKFDPKETINITVLGGSQGATILGSLIPDTVNMLEKSLRERIHIFQQARIEQVDILKARYAELGVAADIQPFYDNIPQLFSISHLVICRAGASSVAELAAIGRPALLLPLPDAVDNHQRINALNMQDAGGCICLDEKTVNATYLSARLIKLFNAPKTLSCMAKSAHSLAKPDAANLIAKLAKKMVEAHAPKQIGVVS